MTETEVKDFILEQEKEGKIVVMTIDGLATMNLNDFINQPTEGILYDLNRNRETVLTYINDPKWVNDYAVGLVIKKLKEMIKEKL